MPSSSSLRCGEQQSRTDNHLICMKRQCTFALFFLLSTLSIIAKATISNNPPYRAYQFNKNNKLIPTPNDSELDANRSIVVDGERVFVPRQIPKLSRANKRQMILEQFQKDGAVPPKQLFEAKWTMNRNERMRRSQKKRRNIVVGDCHYYENRPWRNHYVVRRQFGANLNRKLIVRNSGPCPNQVDAVTEAFNRRLYLFSGDMVYEVWRDQQGLQQRRAYALNELFPDGPKRVTAALTNQRSGVLLLLEWRSVYRYRWNKRHKRFYQARKSPRQLSANQIDFVPSVGFQWKDGHVILANKDKFIAYDPYWNLATFSSAKLTDYFPNLSMGNLVGVFAHGHQQMLWMNKDRRVQIYDLEKHRLGLEMPLNLPGMLACLPSPSVNSTAAITRTTMVTIKPRWVGTPKQEHH